MEQHEAWLFRVSPFLHVLHEWLFWLSYAWKLESNNTTWSAKYNNHICCGTAYVNEFPSVSSESSIFPLCFTIMFHHFSYGFHIVFTTFPSILSPFLQGPTSPGVGWRRENRAGRRTTGTRRRSTGAGGTNPAGRWSLCPGSSWFLKNHRIGIAVW